MAIAGITWRRRRQRWPAPGAPGLTPAAVSPYPVPFPAGFLDQRYELYLGGQWTDVSGYVLPGTGVVITRGHPDESTVTNPSTAPLTVDNTAGRFCEYNWQGAFYGLLGRNIPLRISTAEGASYLRMQVDQNSYAACPASNPLNVTGDLDISIDVTLDNWAANTSLASKWTSAGNQRSWLLDLNEAGTLTFWWSPGGNTTQSATSTAVVPLPPLRRQAIRVTLAVATGTVTFYTAVAQPHQAQLGPVTSGWVQLGAPVVLGATSVFASTAPVSAGNAPGDTDVGYPGPYGKVHKLLVLSGIGGTPVASPDFTVQAPGASSFADAQGNVWAVTGTAEVSNRKYRFHGEVSAWPPSFDPLGLDVEAAIQASGVLRRIQQGNSPLQSPMTRYLARLPASAGLMAWWPGEDNQGSTQVASGMGGPAMTIQSGTPNFAADSSFAGSAPLVQLNGAVLAGAVPAYADTGTVVVRFFLDPVNSGPDVNVLEFETSGLGSPFMVDYFPTVAGAGPTMGVTGQGSGTLFTNPLNVPVGPLLVSAELTSSGGNVTVTLRVLAPGGTVLSTTGTSSAGVTGRATAVRPGLPDSYSGGAGTPGPPAATAVGQVTVQSVLTPLSTFAATPSPLTGWASETAGNRFARLCGEELIAFRGVGNLDASAAMGAQTLETLMALLQECVDTERGVMFEPRQQLGLGFRTLASLQNQQPALILDYSQDQVSPPVTATDDDQYTINDVTLTRLNGSTSRQQQLTGPLNVNPPTGQPPGAGRYDTSITVNPQTDSQLDSIAGQILRVGTVNEMRYPQVSVDLGKLTMPAAVFYAMQDADIGDYKQTVNPPLWLVPGPLPGPLRQIIQGHSEILGLRWWLAEYQGVPESPYEVAWLDPGPILSENDAHFAATVGSWVTVFGTSTLAQTSSPPVAPPCGNAMSVTSNINGECGQLTGLYPCLPRHQYLLIAWFLAATLGQACDTKVNWYAADAATLLSTSAAFAVTDNTTAWSPAAGIVTAPDGAYFMQVITDCFTTTIGQEHYVACVTPADLTWSPPGHLDTDGSILDRSCAAADIVIYVDAANAAFPLWTTAAPDFPFDIAIGPERITVSGITGTTAPQAFSVIRAVNGVAMAHPAGADVRLWNPPILSI